MPVSERMNDKIRDATGISRLILSTLTIFSPNSPFIGRVRVILHQRVDPERLSGLTQVSAVSEAMATIRAAGNED
jgi:hypothetical protein